MATTTTYGLNKPTVGGDENTWGQLTNDNWDDVDDLLDGTTAITPNLGAGWEVDGVAVTATAAELNILDGVTASTAELNILDGVTADATEINLLDGVTALSGSDGILVTGTAGTDGQVAQWNADGDVVGYTLPTLVTSTWEAGTSTNESLVSPAKVKAAIDDLTPALFNASGSAPVYAARAWVNFDGTGAVAIRASGNVSSITDNGTGDYTVNFTTPMPDANYSVVCTTSNPPLGTVTSLNFAVRGTGIGSAQLPVAGAVRVTNHRDNNTGDGVDCEFASVVVFR